jgi:hypothetical protein
LTPTTGAPASDWSSSSEAAGPIRDPIPNAEGQPPAFSAILFKYPGKGGWTFAPVPPEHRPPVLAPWGRTPVIAEVNGREYETSVWRDTAYGCLLPIPKAIRGTLGDGDPVSVRLRPRGLG